jgi:hypothetical protein
MALWRRAKPRRTQILYAAWRIPYLKPANPRRLFMAPDQALEPVQSAALRRWTQYSRSVKSAATKLGLHSITSSLPSHKMNKRETHRSARLKLRKFPNILLTESVIDRHAD